MSRARRSAARAPTGDSRADARPAPGGWGPTPASSPLQGEVAPDLCQSADLGDAEDTKEECIGRDDDPALARFHLPRDRRNGRHRGPAGEDAPAVGNGSEPQPGPSPPETRTGTSSHRAGEHAPRFPCLGSPRGIQQLTASRAGRQVRQRRALARSTPVTIDSLTAFAIDPNFCRMASDRLSWSDGVGLDR